MYVTVEAGLALLFARSIQASCCDGSNKLFHNMQQHLVGPEVIIAYTAVRDRRKNKLAPKLAFVTARRRDYWKLMNINFHRSPLFCGSDTLNVVEFAFAKTIGTHHAPLSEL